MVGIPREKVKDGIYIIKRNVLDLTEEAKRIVQTDPGKIRLRYAYLFIHIAIEELGKALILKEELQDNDLDIIQIPDWVFGKKASPKEIHNSKFNKGWELLDKNTKKVHNGVYKKQDFDPNYYDTDVYASHELRLKCIYVDYDKERWGWLRVKLDKDNLLSLTNNIEKKTKTALY